MSLRDVHANVFLPACPGAGKTHQVVERFLHRVNQETRKGIALLSFSNSAVDEVRTRCGTNVDALRSPNFVGTFDSFIHRFITTPRLNGIGIQPHYVEEWSQLLDTDVRLLGADSANKFPLEWFDFEPDGSCTLEPDRPRSDYWSAHRTIVAARSADLCAQASRRWRQRVDNGFVSCSAARAIAKGLLSDSTSRARIGQRLASRFAEIIVDEMQDCGSDDLNILKLCAEVGIDLVLVADMDQSIYEFRNAVPQEVLQFVSTLTELPGLMDNRRSTPEICTLNNSLRFERTPESALRESNGQPVAVIVGGRPSEIRGSFLELLEAQTFDPSDAVVLAHRSTDAKRIAGLSSTSSTTTDRVASLAVAIGIVSDPLADPRTKRRALSQIEAVLLRFIGADGGAPIAETLVTAGISDRWFRRLVASVSTGLRDDIAGGRSSFTQSLKDRLSAVSWPSGNGLVSGSVRTPTERSWGAVLTPGPEPDAIRAATIHSVKGQEFPAVLLVLPNRPRPDADGLSVLDHWERDHSSESRRVLYVGGSRPTDILALAVPPAGRDQLIRILEATNVTYVETAISTS